MKKAFVTGANGFIGSFLLKRLAEQGIEVTGFILNGTDCELLEKIYPSMKNITIVEGNILDMETFQKYLQDMNYVFHTAGIIQGYIQEDYDRVNVNGTRNVLDLCLKNNPNLERVVLLSSGAAAGYYGTPDEPLNENVIPNPHPKDFYAVSKYKMEHLAKRYSDKLSMSIVRPCSVIGPGNKVIIGNYILAKYGFKLRIAGPRRPLSIIDVEDLVEGIYLCAITPEANDEVFYFCANDSVSTEEIAEIAAYKVFNRKYGRLITIPVPYPLFKATTIIMETINRVNGKPAPFVNQTKLLAAYSQGQVLCSNKAKEILDWEPKRSIVSAITREGKWFIDNGWV